MVVSMADLAIFVTLVFFAAYADTRCGSILVSPKHFAVEGLPTVSFYACHAYLAMQLSTVLSPYWAHERAWEAHWSGHGMAEDFVLRCTKIVRRLWAFARPYQDYST